jgi:hypothetical protein
MVLTIKTFLRVRMEDGTLKTFLSGGHPCRTKQGPRGYQSLAEMRKELRRRWNDSYVIEDIHNGLKLTPAPGYPQTHAWQEVTLEEGEL